MQLPHSRNLRALTQIFYYYYFRLGWVMKIHTLYSVHLCNTVCMTFFMSSPSSLSRSFTPVHFCIHLSKVRINVGSIIAWRNQYEGRKDVQEGKGKCRQHCFLLKIAGPTMRAEVHGHGHALFSFLRY